MSETRPDIIIGLNAVILSVRGDQPVVLVSQRLHGDGEGLPFGPLDASEHPTLERGLRALVKDQTGFAVGFVEQLYTFGDLGRDEAVARDFGRAEGRVLSVGYLGLAPEPKETTSGQWRSWYDFFPWEDWRSGRPGIIDEIAPLLQRWASIDDEQMARVIAAFALDGRPWNDEQVLERYELMYEARLVHEAPDNRISFGHNMGSDHRRILATALSRLRGKIKYRPVIFELMPHRFTLLALQEVTEAILGLRLHKQNFRRALDKAGLVTRTGDMDSETGGRPAALYEFNDDVLTDRRVVGISAPRLKGG